MKKSASIRFPAMARLKACTEVLGLTEFNEDVFLDQVDHIDVPEKYTLVFYLI